MPGEWNEALRLLRPCMTAADEAARAAQGQEVWLAGIAAASAQYAEAINGAVSYFLQAMATHRPDMIEAIREGQSSSIRTVRGSVHASAAYQQEVYWRFVIKSAEWPGKTPEDEFVVHASGRWYFGHENQLGGDIGSIYPITVYGFDHNMQWVPSSFPPVAAGTVVTIVQMHLLALMHYYDIPLPS